MALFDSGDIGGFAPLLRGISHTIFTEEYMVKFLTSLGYTVKETEIEFSRQVSAKGDYSYYTKLGLGVFRDDEPACRFYGGTTANRETQRLVIVRKVFIDELVKRIPAILMHIGKEE